MVKRARIQRYDSDEIQGEGSYVIVSQLTVGEMRIARKAGNIKGADIIELTIDTVKTHTLEWNWVDDEGVPFPQPTDEPDVIDLLTEREAAFLGNCIVGSEEKAKN